MLQIELNLSFAKTANQTGRYELPTDDNKEWLGSQRKDFVPSLRQQFVIEAVEEALKQSLFYTSDVVQFCAKYIGVSNEDLAANYSNAPVENGKFGMDCYYARQYLQARKEQAYEADSANQLLPQIGQKIGVIMFNDFKRCTNAIVSNIIGDEIELTLKRGVAAYSVKTTASSIRHAIDRAFEKKLRKTDFQAFILKSQQ